MGPEKGSHLLRGLEWRTSRTAGQRTRCGRSYISQVEAIIEMETTIQPKEWRRSDIGFGLKVSGSGMKNGLTVA
jgi:hypothetical protein